MNESNNENKSVNLFPIHFTGDLTEVINKAYNDITAPFKYVANGFAFLVAYITCEARVKMFKKTELAKKEMEDFAFTLKNFHDKIPEENVVKPRMSILGPATDVLKYNFDELTIKTLFINLLSKEMDNRTQNKILPSYIEIIKQLSIEDAKYLKSLSECDKQQISLCFVKLKYLDKEGTGTLDIIIVDNNYHTIKPPRIVLDNFERLNLIKISEECYNPEDNLAVKNAFDFYKRDYPLDDPNVTIFYEQGILVFSDFGKQFIDICCSEIV